MLSQIEALNFEEAKDIYNSLVSMYDLIKTSPYNIEFKIYQLIYNSFVEGICYTELMHDMQALDKIYSSLNEDLQYLYMFVSGRIIFKYKDHSEGIQRQTTAQRIKDTPWNSYLLGFSYCFNNEPMKGSYYLAKALESYEGSGRYINAMWCHNYLGICYAYLKIYEKAEEHYKAALTGAKHFNIHTILEHLYINLSALYYRTEDYMESIKWAKLAMDIASDPILAAHNYIDACIKLDMLEECKATLDKYLTETYQSSRYYNLLYFSYLSIYHFEEKRFYDEITQKVLPYYEGIGYIEICNNIKLKLIEYLEKNRKYKEANKLYKELLL